MRTAILIGSTRHNRLGERVALFIKSRAAARGLDADLIDPLKAAFPVMNAYYREMDDRHKTDAMTQAAESLARADGFIIVSPEYNWSVPPALSNLIDHFQTEFRKKPFGFITYSVGPFGGRAAAAALPTLVVGVGGVAVPAAMQIPAAQNQMDAAGKPLNDQLERFGDEFIAKYEWYLRVFSAANRAEA